MANYVDADGYIVGKTIPTMWEEGGSASIYCPRCGEVVTLGKDSGPEENTCGKCGKIFFLYWEVWVREVSLSPEDTEDEDDMEFEFEDEDEYEE